MSNRPVFVYAATYADETTARSDYDSLLELHAAKLLGTYDVALLAKDDDGKVHVKKHEADADELRRELEQAEKAQATS
ncbi:MAG TPA: hypothetical protein VEJ23_08490 [Solirubrobacteraceae bacterium]|nr:hypothetical protein [Solirubrobacteraceae bacterium]